MSERIKDVVVTVLFLVIIFGVFIISTIVKDKEVSTAERRKLNQFPNISESLMSGNLTDDMENYAMDQFLARDNMRSIKTFVKLNVLLQKENNGLFTIEDKIFKLEYPLNESSVTGISNKINNIYDTYLTENNNVYYTIVPDKNYFLEDKGEYIKLDYQKIEDLMRQTINSNIEYIDIFDTLALDSYYNTDTHWKQESIMNVADKISTQMNFRDRITTEFELKEYGEFYGAYYGQLGKNMTPDTINYLTNEVIDSAVTFNYETQKEAKVYNTQKADTAMDKYDIYLSGATALIEIRNEKATTDKELIIFRDSFGSSIAPLFTEAYSKIYLVDTRYIAPTLISNYIEFNNQDVLFLYSTLIINNSGSLK
ncbi:MAG: hypothetical protein J6A15_06955 [Clostridia bacterium]|nr:hypothetical protein [Clostridia bacterium]